MNADLIYEFGRLRQPPSASAEIDLFLSRQWIIKALIEMRKAGIFRMVYCDNNHLAVVVPSINDEMGTIRQVITWPQALQMVEEFHRQSANGQVPLLVERKPPTRSDLPNEAKAKCR